MFLLASELNGMKSYLPGTFVIQNSNRQALIGQLQYVDFQGLGDAQAACPVLRIFDHHPCNCSVADRWKHSAKPRALFHFCE